MSWRRLCVLLAASILSFSFAAELRADEPAAGKQVAQELTGKPDGDSKLAYQLFLPKAYGQADKKWPLILFLHGAGERGDDIDLVKKHGPPKNVEGNPDFQFIVVSPQCPKNENWNKEQQQGQLLALLDSVIAKYNVDTDRIYLTGLSMGGYGSFGLAAVAPERFAAVVPICGGGRVDTADKLAGLPLWVFHGAKDIVVPVKRSEEMVEAIRALGGDVTLTIYPDANHDSWTATYDNPELYDWFLKHTASGNQKKASE